VSENSGHKQICLEFDDNERLSLLCGQHNRHLVRIEQALHVGLSSFGNQITIAGEHENVDKASQAFTSLYRQLSNHDTSIELSSTLVDDLLRQAENGLDLDKSPIDKSVFATTWKK
jgi:phosphate starvation-inducible PhoH-like protein